jgi:ABC-type thiamin/hydroxymethylpyrimidine transport system permease subunit
MNDLVIIHYIVIAVHLGIGLGLVYLSMKAFKKTKYPPMALLALGFSMIVLGDTVIGDILKHPGIGLMGEILEETIEIGGFIVLLIAVKRS